MANSKLHITKNNTPLSLNPNWIKEIKEDPDISEEMFHDLWAIAKCYPKDNDGKIDCHINYPEGDIGSLIPCCPNAMNGFFSDNTTALKITGKTDGGGSETFGSWWYNPNGIRKLLPPVITNESYSGNVSGKVKYFPSIKILNPNPFPVALCAQILNLPLIEYSGSTAFTFNNYSEDSSTRTFTATRPLNRYLPSSSYTLSCKNLIMLREDGSELPETVKQNIKVEVYYTFYDESTDPEHIHIAEWYLSDSDDPEQQKTVYINTNNKQIKNLEIKIIESKTDTSFQAHHGTLQILKLEAAKTLISHLDAADVLSTEYNGNYILYNNVTFGEQIPFISYLKFQFTFELAVWPNMKEKLKNYGLVDADLPSDSKIIHFVKYNLTEAAYDAGTNVFHVTFPSGNSNNNYGYPIQYIDYSYPAYFHISIDDPYEIPISSDYTQSVSKTRDWIEFSIIGNWANIWIDKCPDRQSTATAQGKSVPTTDRIAETSNEYLFTCPSDSINTIKNTGENIND